MQCYIQIEWQTQIKTVTDTQKIQGKESKHFAKESQLIMRRESKRRKDLQKQPKNKQQSVKKKKPHISIINLNANGLNAPIKQNKTKQKITG